jgi:ribosome-associated protein
MVKITNHIEIPDEEFTFTASRSSGPGGQNVNKVSSRVTLTFDILRSPSLSEEQKAILQHRLKGRINKQGILRIIGQETRSQADNREAVIHRFVEMVNAALKRPPVRKKTKVSYGAKLRRLEEKKHQSRIKQIRSKSSFED